MRRASALIIAVVAAAAEASSLHSLPRTSAQAPASALLRLRGGKKPSLAVVPRKAESQQLRGGAAAPSLALKIPRELQLIFGAVGIFVSFSVFAVLQEDVYKTSFGGEKFASTFFALVIERGVNALTALLGDLALGPSGLVIPHKEIFNSGISQMLAMAASNEALRYVSYPTQVLGKSCKMVPVMAGGIILGGKRYTLIEYLQVLLITVGVVLFNFGIGKKKKDGHADSPLGLFLIAGSLLMDGFTGGLQDKVKARTKELNPTVTGVKRPSMHESMLWTNASGCLMALFFAILSGHLFTGLQFSTKHPKVLQAIIVYSISSAVGQNFVYFTLTQFNPLVLTTVTTTRKIFSTLFSVWRNPANRLTPMQWAGCSCVFTGLLGDIARKIGTKPPPLPKPLAKIGFNETAAAPPVNAGASSGSA